jgi:hypothetical protein
MARDCRLKSLSQMALLDLKRFFDDFMRLKSLSHIGI